MLNKSKLPSDKSSLINASIFFSRLFFLASVSVVCVCWNINFLFELFTVCVNFTDVSVFVIRKKNYFSKINSQEHVIKRQLVIYGSNAPVGNEDNFCTKAISFKLIFNNLKAKIIILDCGHKLKLCQTHTNWIEKLGEWRCTPNDYSRAQFSNYFVNG